ncbi:MULTISPECIES: hypothetical protein [unclassified Pseudomonas]|uniref:hypothetical protein n=1 Tax=unclassified Pseudomonas TaxID=196821 RepID=UPI0005B79B48|nr:MULTISPECIES: hypothetical protein [unclassified Pseudomonas]KWR85504.1 hypothetical protein RN02_02285 [Pseudomonas sp. PI1]MED5607801.1 hypothetical protein [Pseudomonas sp. JH-2]
MSTTQAEFIELHAPDGQMTAEQAAQLIELSLQGDTGAAPVASPEPGSAPAAAPASDAQTSTTGEQPPQEEPQAQGQAAPSPQEGELNPENAVILAKDGKHTIDYQKLVDARESEKAAKAEAQEVLGKLQAAQQELDALKAQAQQRADAGIAPTATDANAAAAQAAIDAGVDPELFGDFSEQDLAKGVRALVNKDARALIGTEVPALVEKLVEAKLAQAVTPLQQKHQSDAQDAHFRAISEKHPDFDSVIESKELSDWIAKQPTFAQAGYNAVLEKGTSAEIVELLDSFKAATQPPQPAQAASTKDVQAAAEAAVANAKPQVPASLSEIPGGAGAPLTGDEAIAAMDPVSMLDRMQNMTPKQIEAFLSRNL